MSLVAAMMFNLMAPAIAEAVEGPEILNVQNRFVQLMVNKENGGFVVKTVEGSLARKSDQNKNLLYQGENYDTSFATFRIDGKDYIFGNNYGFLGLGGQFITPPVNDGLANDSVWKVGDIEIEQKLEVVNDVSSPYIGNVVIKYNVTNKGSSAADIGARIMLDTMLGSNDGAPFELGDDISSRIEAEQRLTGTDVPNFWKAYDSFDAPGVIAYGFNAGWQGSSKPDEFVMAHWNNLAATKWDCAVNPLVNFATIDNDYGTADSAAAMYWDPASLAVGQTVSFETVYGVMTGNEDALTAGFDINVMAPREIELTADANDYENDGLFDIQLEIDNTLAAAEDLTMLTAQLQLEDGLVLAPGEESVAYINELPANDTQIIRWQVKAETQNNYSIRKFKVDVTRSGYSPVAETGFIILPGKRGAPPDIQFNVIGPEKIYYEGEKIISIEGIGLDNYRDKGHWDLYMEPVDNNDPAKVTQIPDDNVFLSTDYSQMTVIVNDDLDLGEHLLYFNWTEDAAFPKDTRQELPYDVMVTNDERDRSDRYGILCVVKNSGNDYELQAYRSEDALADAALGDKLLMELRGVAKKVDPTSNNFVIDTSLEPVIINGIVSYSGDLMNVNDENGTITVSGNGPIQVIGALTFWKWEFEIPFTDGEDYVLTEELQAGESPIQVDLLGLGSLLQGIGGFVMDLDYGVFRRIEKSGEKYNAISFGGRMSLPIFPGSISTSSDNSNSGSSGGTGGASGGTSDGSSTDTNSGIPVMGGITADVDDVLFGERQNKDPGFIGIDVTTSIAMPDNAFGGLIQNGFSASVMINTIDNIYSVQFGVQVQIIQCSGELTLMLHEGKYPVPDTLLVSGGGDPGIPVVPGIFYITNIGGGYSDLYDSIFGDSYLLPLTLHLSAGASLFDVLDINAEMEMAMTHFSISGDAQLFGIIPIMEDLTLYMSWVDGFYTQIRGTIYLYQGFIEGSACITITDDFVEGWARVALQIPNYIPIVGGFNIAGAEVGIGTIKVWGKVFFLGLQIGVIYYWETNDVEVVTGEDADQIAAVVASSLGDFETFDRNGRKVHAYLGTNTVTIASTGPGIRDVLPRSGGVLASAPTITSNSDRTEHTLTLNGMYGAFIKTEYFDSKPSVTVTKPDGSNYNLVDADVTGDYQNANMRTQIIPADYEAGTTEKKYIIISIPPSEMADGDWTVSATAPIEVSLTEVGALPTLTGAEATLNPNPVTGDTVTVNWKAENAGSALVDIYLCKDAESDSGTPLNEGLTTNSSGQGSCTAELPATLASGQYYIRTVMKQGDSSYEFEYAENTATGGTAFDYVNSNQPQPPAGVTAQAFGSGYLSADVSYINSGDIDGYMVDVLDDGGNPVTTFNEEYFGVDDTIIVGGWTTSTPMDFSTDPPTELAPISVGLEPGHSYRVRVRAYKNIAVPGEGEFKLLSAPAASGTVFLPVPDPAEITVTYGDGFTDSVDDAGYPVKLTNGAATKLHFAADMDVEATLMVNGSYYGEFSGQEWDAAIPLEDGNHVIKVIAYNDNNDNTVLTVPVTVDTTPPHLMVSSPVKGGVYEGGKVTLKAAVEVGAQYTITVDGNPVVSDDPLTGAISADGLLEYTVPVTGSQLVHNISVSATDEAGNTSTYNAPVLNGAMGALDQAFIRAAEISDDQLTIKEGDTVQLELIGSDAGNEEFVLNSPQTDWTVLEGSGNVSVTPDGEVTGITSGTAVVLGSFSIAADYSFADALVVEVTPGGNLPPAAGGSQSFDVRVNSPAAINLDKIFTDPNGDPMTYSASLGTVTGSTWEYTPTSTGIVTVYITAADSYGAATVSTLTLNVYKKGDHDNIPTVMKGLSPENVDSLISDAIGKGTGKLIIDAVIPSAPNLQMRLPADLLKRAGEAGLNPIVIKTALGEISFDTDAFDIDALNTGAPDVSDVKFIQLDFGRVSPLELSVAAQQETGNRPVYNIGITAIREDGSERELTEFASPLRIQLPYALRPGENLEQVTVFCLDPDGSLENMAGTYTGGGIWFTTNHLSYFLARFNEVTFSDVPDSAWYSTEAEALAAKGIINGMGNGLFRPEGNVTRAQFAAMLARLLKLKLDPDTGRFKDVTAGAWYAGSVNACAAAGIVNGSSDGIFAPDARISRQDMAVMLGRALEYVNGYRTAEQDANQVLFADRGKIAPYALNQVGAAVKHGIISGKPGNVFDPQGTATRAEAARVFYVLYGMRKGFAGCG